MTLCLDPSADSIYLVRCHRGVIPHYSASKTSILRFVITEKASTRAFSWLKAATTTFTFKTLLRHYAKWALTPRSLNMKLGPQLKGERGSSHFQPGEGPSRGLLRDYEPSDGPF